MVFHAKFNPTNIGNIIPIRLSVSGKITVVGKFFGGCQIFFGSNEKMCIFAVPFRIERKMVPVVQLVRASDCGSECRGFESHPAPWETGYCP